jgi:ABC-type glutathione transport system ATPase component
VNNLSDVSIEIPKRRLTAFTGVSGSGKSSLVFGTIAAESQRLINETYSASSAAPYHDREGDLHRHRRHVPALRGPGHGHRLRPVGARRLTGEHLAA